MRIIFGTDFSDNAGRAGRAAAALAHRLNDSLCVVHSLEAGGLGAISPSVLDAFTSGSRADLAAEAVRLRQLGPAVKTELLTGAADEAIVTKAAAPGVRLVVVSSLGRRAPGRWLLGSVSERVAESSPVPTLVVREDQSLVTWAAGKRPLRVLCAYDFSPAADAALAQLKELRRVGPCEIVVALVDWPLGEKLRLGLPGSIPMEENPPEVQAVLERDLREKVATTLRGAEVRLRIEPGWGRADFRLIELAKAEAADLIVTGAHQWRGVERLWHTSTSRGLLHYAPLNVLVVPAAAAPSGAPLPAVRRVLAATDFSELGNAAIPHAYAALAAAGGTVKLVHVLPPWESPGPLVPHYRREPATPKRHKQQLAAAARKLRALIPPEAEERGITTELEIVPGRNAAEAICQAAERFGAQVICLGTHGRSGFSKVLLGSVAGSVLSHSNRPLLMIRPKQA